jgi:hypothetical protein
MGRVEYPREAGFPFGFDVVDQLPSWFSLQVG